MSQKSSTATVVKEQIQDAGLGMDLITFEVMRNAFVAACYEASTTIERIAYHPVIGMGRDRSNAILTPDARLVAHGHTDAAAHYASFEPSVQELLKDISRESMKPGDTFLFSDSVAGNIAFADPDASVESIERAARLAGAAFDVGLAVRGAEL